MEDLTKLKNIGSNLQNQLHEVGIYSFDELKRVGSKNAWIKIKAIDSSACIHRLLALEGAIRNINKKELSEKIKEDLHNFYIENK